MHEAIVLFPDQLVEILEQPGSGSSLCLSEERRTTTRHLREFEMLLAEPVRFSERISEELVVEVLNQQVDRDPNGGFVAETERTGIAPLARFRRDVLQQSPMQDGDPEYVVVANQPPGVLTAEATTLQELFSKTPIVDLFPENGRDCIFDCLFRPAAGGAAKLTERLQELVVRDVLPE